MTHLKLCIRDLLLSCGGVSRRVGRCGCDYRRLPTYPNSCCRLDICGRISCVTNLIKTLTTFQEKHSVRQFFSHRFPQNNSIYILYTTSCIYLFVKEFCMLAGLSNKAITTYLNLKIRKSREKRIIFTNIPIERSKVRMKEEWER